MKAKKGEKLSSNNETTFTHNGREYGLKYSFVYDRYEVLAVQVDEVWDYEVDLTINLSPVNDSNILIGAAANRAAELQAQDVHWYLVEEELLRQST